MLAGLSVQRGERAIEQQPAFSVGAVPIFGDVVLAPMVGFADVPHRKLCRQFGAVMSYSEFINAREVFTNRPKVLSLLDFTADDRPMVFQLFGNDPHQILRAAQVLEELSPDVIDINMGCSTRRVSGRGAGVAMMREPRIVAKTLRLLTQHLQVPVTAKLRLGWADKINYLEIGRVLEDNGAALIALHPRTKEQGYKGKANWRAIARLKGAVSIPVIGNGDVTDIVGIDRMKNATGCDAVMIGRGAIGNPWIFSRQSKELLTYKQLTAIVKEHLEEMIAYYGDKGLILFRKYVKRYFSGLGALRADIRGMVRVKSQAEFLEILAVGERRYGSVPIRELSDF